jgi:hypothetical protein
LALETLRSETTSQRRFLRAALVFFVGLAVLQNWPVLLGRVPLPMDIAFTFPPWETFQRPEFATQHAELGDLITEFYPWRAFTSRAVQHRVLPLWNPYSLLGTPFQATPLNALFYPLIILYYILPATLAWTLSYLLRPVLAGAFSAWFGRTIEMSGMGALLTGVCFAFSSFMVVWQGWPQADTALWLPLVFVGTEKLRQSPSVRTALGLSVACALTFLGGHPGIALYVFLAAGLFALYRVFWVSNDVERRTRFRFVSLAVVALALTVALTAVQLLPMLEWVRLTERSPEAAKGWYLPASKLVSFFCRDANSSPNYAGLVVPEEATYCGIATLVLAFFGFLRKERGMAVFFLLLAIFANQIVFGWGPGYWLSVRAPALKAFNNMRFVVIACFSIAVLAGLGLSFLQEQAARGPNRLKSRLRWWTCWIAAGAGIGVGIMVLQSFSNRAALARTSWIYRPEGAAVLLLLALLISCPFAERFGKHVGLAALLLGIADLLTFSYRHSPFFPAHDVFPTPPVLRKLRERDPSLYRVLTIDDSFPSNATLMYGFFSASGYEFPLARTLRVLHVFADGEIAPDVRANRLVRDRTRLLDMMNVKYLIGNAFLNSATALEADPRRFRMVLRDHDVEVVENLRVLPHAYLVPAEKTIVARSPEDAFQRVISPSFDPLRDAVIERTEANPRMPPPGTGPREMRLVVRSGINECRIDGDVPRASLLVLSDAYYPGWQVTVDGRRRELLRTNYAFRGVFVESGSHTIEFRFRPVSLMVGAVISGATLLLIALTPLTPMLVRRVARRPMS